MKKCPNCQSVYDDSKSYCAKCGTALIEVATTTPTTQTRTTAPSTNQSSTDFFSSWGGLILGIVGVVIAWELSALLGCILSIIGATSGMKSSNGVNKVGSIICAVLGVLLWIITMAASI